MIASVSVVVPSYNRKHLLPETLSAIEAQRHRPLEVILVDDGSEDGTAEFVEREHPEIRLIRIANSGELVARNTGLRAARGEIVAFCDSDDLWLPDHLARMVALWRDEPGLRAAFANFRLFGEGQPGDADKFGTAPADWFEGVRRLGSEQAIFAAPFMDRMVRFNPVFPSALAVRRDDFLAQGGWDESIGRQVSLDFATTLRIAARPPVGVVLAPTVLIRKHAGNFSGDVQKMNLGDAVALEHVLARYPEFLPLEREIRVSVRRRRLQALDCAFARADFPAVGQIRALLGGAALPLRTRIKIAVAGLPPALRGPAVRGLLALGSLKAREGWR
jgi:glycosyltransferase involved in cell wall biosynthesis